MSAISSVGSTAATYQTRQVAAPPKQTPKTSAPAPTASDPDHDGDSDSGKVDVKG